MTAKFGLFKDATEDAIIFTVGKEGKSLKSFNKLVDGTDVKKILFTGEDFYKGVDPLYQLDDDFQKFSKKYRKKGRTIDIITQGSNSFDPDVVNEYVDFTHILIRYIDVDASGLYRKSMPLLKQIANKEFAFQVYAVQNELVILSFIQDKSIQKDQIVLVPNFRGRDEAIAKRGTELMVSAFKDFPLVNFYVSPRVDVKTNMKHLIPYINIL